MTEKSSHVSLTEAQITSTRNLDRRTVLATLGLGAGAAALTGLSTQAHASDPRNRLVCDADADINRDQARCRRVTDRD